MTDVVRPNDLSDILAEYIDHRPVQAVRLDDATTIARVGRWILESGRICTWDAAAGGVSKFRGGEVSNRLTIHPPVAGDFQDATIGDWIVRRGRSEFAVVSDDVFHDVFDPVFKGHIVGELEEE